MASNPRRLRRSSRTLGEPFRTSRHCSLVGGRKMIDRRQMIAAAIAVAVTPWADAAGRRLDQAFPKGFLWGAATSGHQTEGNNVNADMWVVENAKPTVYVE